MFKYTLMLGFINQLVIRQTTYHKPNSNCMLVIMHRCYVAIALVLSKESYVYVVYFFMFYECMVGFM